MIKVVRITGEGFDIESSKSVGPQLVISNGTSEVTIPIDDAILSKVIQLIAVKAPEAEKVVEPEINPEKYYGEDEEVGSI
jgi:hypothetical protein